jgi:hypothetical protein
MLTSPQIARSFRKAPTASGWVLPECLGFFTIKCLLLIFSTYQNVSQQKRFTGRGGDLELFCPVQKNYSEREHRASAS